MSKFGIVAGLLLASLAFAGERGAWVSLFDGKSLDGWRAEGKAVWSAENGTLIGRQGPGETPGDLYTERQWKDFEFECEYKVAWPANTGIWFRVSATQPGYQADILDEPKAYPDALSGSLYAMRQGNYKQGFIAKNGDPTTMKKEDWNRLGIIAIGDELTVIMNGKKVVQTRDSRFPQAGSIGIQVHPGQQFKGMEVAVRKIRIRPVAAK